MDGTLGRSVCLPRFRPMLLPTKLAVAVTFFFSEHRIVYLKTIGQRFSEPAETVEIYIVTNEREAEKLRFVTDAFEGTGLKVRFVIPHLLGHPFLLTWTHLEVFRHIITTDSTISHFMYVEDDILVRAENVDYWMRGRQSLREFGLYPSFVRYEQRNNTGPAYASDAFGSADGDSIPVLFTEDDYCYVNLPWPYQGMYFMDREMMHEHLFGPSSNPDFGDWLIREKAAQGLTFKSVPKGFTSRNLVGYRLDQGRIDEFCLVHHTPNNYVDLEGTALGKTPISTLVKPRIPKLPKGTVRWLAGTH